MDDENDAIEVAEIMTNLKDALPKACFSKPVPTSKVIILTTSSEESKPTKPSDKAPQLKVALESRQIQCKTDKILKKFEALGTKDSVIDLSIDEIPIKSSPSWEIQEAKKTVKKEPSYPKVKTKVSSSPLIQYMKQLQKINSPKIFCKHCKKTLVPKDTKNIGANETKYYRGTGVSGNVMHHCNDFKKMVARSLKKPYRNCKKRCRGSCLTVTSVNSKALFSKKPIGLTMSDIIKAKAQIGASSSSTSILKKNMTKMSCVYAPPYGYYITYQNGDKTEHIPLFTTVSIPLKSEKKRARKRRKTANRMIDERWTKNTDYGMLKCNHCQGIFTKQRGDGFKQYQTCNMKHSTQHLCTATDRGTKQIWRSLAHPYRGCTLGCKTSCIVKVTRTDEPWSNDKL